MHMKIAYKDRIGLEIMFTYRQQDKCRERHVQAAINAPPIGKLHRRNS